MTGSTAPAPKRPYPLPPKRPGSVGAAPRSVAPVTSERIDTMTDKPAVTKRFTTFNLTDKGGWVIYDAEADDNARFGNTEQGRQVAETQARIFNHDPDRAGMIRWDREVTEDGDTVGAPHGLTEAARQRRDERIVAIHTLVGRDLDPAALTALRALGVTEAELDLVQGGDAS